VALSTSLDRPAGGPSKVLVLRGAIPRRLHLALAVLTSLVLLLVWEAAVRLGLVNPIFLPAPTTIIAAFWRLIWSGSLLWHTGISILRVWTAFLLAVVIAVPVGILMSSYRVIGASIEPIVDFIRYVPVPALVPLSIIWFGVGESTKIFLLWMGTFFQLVLLVADEMRRVPQEYIETAYTVGAKPRNVLTDVAFRAMLPGLMDSFRITLGWCWTYLILAEIVAADSGLGFVIWAARRFMQTPNVMAGVLMIGIVGLVTDQAVRQLNRRLFPYL
jgi:NitT/TauT family transport system permease protein